jgi:hypothetical protein
MNGQQVESLEALGERTDLFLDAPIIFCFGIKALGVQHVDKATSGRLHELQDLDGGGLARPVRTQQGKNFATGHFERYVANGRVVRVVLD